MFTFRSAFILLAIAISAHGADGIDQAQAKYDFSLEDCSNESIVVLGGSENPKHNMSYIISCMELLGWSTFREEVLNSEYSDSVTDERLNRATGKTYKLLAMERKEYEAKYCSEPIQEYLKESKNNLNQNLLRSFFDRMEMCLEEFDWSSEKLGEVMGTLRKELK